VKDGIFLCESPFFNLRIRRGLGLVIRLALGHRVGKFVREESRQRNAVPAMVIPDLRTSSLARRRILAASKLPATTERVSRKLPE
jgi:hypothetical protein